MYVHVYKNICNVVLPCRFDSDLSACKEDASSEVQAKEQLAREKDQLHTDFEDLKTKLKVCNILWAHVQSTSFLVSRELSL